MSGRFMVAPNGERGWVEGTGAPSGWRDASEAEAKAFDAEDRQAELASGLSGAKGLGEIALNAATAGEYGGNLERQRAVAAESPGLTAVAEAAPGIVAEVGLAVTTGGVGLAAEGALGAAASAAAGRAKALRNEQAYGLADLAQDGAMGGLAGPLLGRALAKGAAAVGRSAGDLTEGLASKVLESEAAKNAARVLDSANALGLRASGVEGLKAVSKRAADAAGEAAKAEADLLRAAARGPKLSKLVTGSMSEEALDASHGALRAAAELPDATPELRALVGEAAERLRSGVSTRSGVLALQRASAKARDLGLGSAADQLDSVLANPAVVGERAAMVARISSAASRGDAKALRSALDEFGDHPAAAARKAADEAQEASRRWAELAGPAGDYVAATAGVRGVADQIGDPATAGALGVVGGWHAVAAASGAAKALKFATDAAISSTTRQLFETGTSLAARGMRAAGQAAGQAARYGTKVAAQAAGRSEESLYLDRKAQIEALAAEPTAMVNQLGSALDEDPATRDALSESTMRALAHLNETMPRALASSVRSPDGPMPERSALARWNRQFEAVTAPLDVLPRLAAGRATPAEWRALETAHPELGERVRQSIVAELAAGRRVPERHSAYLEAVLGAKLVPPLAIGPVAPPQAGGPRAADGGSAAGAGTPRSLADQE